MTRRLVLVLLASIALAPPAHAQDAAIRHALRTGQGAVWLGHAPTGRAEVLVRFERPGLAGSLRALENRGVSQVRIAGEPLVWREWALVSVDAEGARALATLQGVREVRVPPPLGLPPLDRSAERLGLEAARGASRVSERWTGQGVLVADLDSHVDVFHPDFFFADAGWYDWIDADRDGRYSAGDGVDLDRDGELDADERSLVLRGAPLDLYGRSTDTLTRRSFDPAVDWIYCDTDGNRERDFGPRFGDATPAFGEPLFVPDDVDGDGVLDPEERLVRLGTSKLRAAYVRVEWPGIAHDHVYERGVDLSSSPNDVTGGIYGYADTLHATGVLGILAGGVALPSRRWVGVAPDAEIVNLFEIAQSDAGRMLWALSQEPDVVLHEYVSWARVALDGTDTSSAMIDQSAAEGVAHVCPGGNIGGSNRHVERDVAADGEAMLTLRVPADVRQLEIAVHARGPGALSAELIEQDGTTHALSVVLDERTLGGGGQLYTYGETTSRGTQMRFASILSPGGGAFGVRVRAAGGALTIHAMSSDDYGFGEGAAWDGATSASTIAAPATADGCIAVGSVPSHVATEGPWYAYDEAEGELRAYSARGPRIDGALRPHVLAPDNPWSAVGHGDLAPFSPGAYVAPHGAYMVFGGTSGAGPHVAGVAALLAQTGMRGGAIGDAIRETAIDDGLGGALPNDDWGHGRLSAVAAMGGDASGEPPSITLRAEPANARPDQPVRLIVVASDAEGEVAIRWDDDYDGDWDTSYGPVAERSVSFSREGVYRWKVRARDEAGLIADAAVMVTVAGDPPPADAGTQLDAGADGGTAAPSGGCGCRASGRPSGPWWALAAIAITLARPRAFARRPCRTRCGQTAPSARPAGPPRSGPPGRAITLAWRRRARAR